MTQHNNVNFKLSNSQLNKLKSPIKTYMKVTLRSSSSMIRSFNEENNFPHKTLLLENL